MKKIDRAIENYQCCGCMRGSDISCFKPDSDSSACGSHKVGTFTSYGSIFLGLPKGFNRLGGLGEMKLLIFTDWKDFEQKAGYDNYNIPTWKYLDEHGNTLIRGLKPRLNTPFLHVIIGNHLDRVNCLEVSAEMIEYMD